LSCCPPELGPAYRLHWKTLSFLITQLALKTYTTRAHMNIGFSG
jgi:hypothetical protein